MDALVWLYRNVFSPGKMFLKATIAFILILCLCFCLNAKEVRRNNQRYTTKLLFTSSGIETNISDRYPTLFQNEANQLYSTAMNTPFRDTGIRNRRSVMELELVWPLVGITSPPFPYFLCHSFMPIPIFTVCDGVNNCENGLDEKHCDTFICPPHTTRCNSSRQCFPFYAQCDGERHCMDNSDETNCDNATCPVGYFRCTSGQCVLYVLRCDGTLQCEDSSDESDCQNMTCPEELVMKDGICSIDMIHCEWDYMKIWSLTPEAAHMLEWKNASYCENYKCIDQDSFKCNESHGLCYSWRYRCDGSSECMDGSDERSCQNTTCKFVCKNGQCMQYEAAPILHLCDGWNHCSDGTDEEDCESSDCGSNYFTCPGGGCAELFQVCDRFPNCINGSDEENCEEDRACLPNEYRCQTGICLPMTQALCKGYFTAQEIGFSCPIFHDDESQCPFIKCPANYTRLEAGGCSLIVQQHNSSCSPFATPNRCRYPCTSLSYLQCCNCRCVHRISICDGINDCPDGADERHCGKPDCRADQFYCGNITCVPLELRCDGFIHCPNGHDETDCKQNQTTKFTKHNTSSISNDNYHPFVDFQHKCFDSSICLTPKDLCTDETIYFECEEEYHTSNCFIVCNAPCECEKPGIMKCNAGFLTDSLKYNPDSVWPFNKSTLIVGDNDWGGNQIDSTLFTFQKLAVVHITNANLSRLPSRLLSCAFNIHYLNLSHNAITHIYVGDFGRLYRLSVLDLSNNLITSIEGFSFKGMRVFDLRLEHNLISDIGVDLFSGMAADGTIVTDEFRLCCLRPAYFPEHNCYPKGDQFSSCSDLMKNTVLTILLWILGLVALIGNISVLLSKIFLDGESTKGNYGIMVTNLAVADVLMAVYLLSIASVDAMYRGTYATEEAGWRNSPWCTLVGLVCMVSSEASVLFMCLITIDRYIVIKYPFGQVRLGRSTLKYVSIAIWISAIAIAVLPVAITPYFKGNFFNKSGVCIALPLTTDSFDGWEYSFAISVCLNFVLFVIVFVGQCLIYRELFMVRKQSLVSTRRKNDSKIARKLMFVVLSNFSCWVPIGVMGTMTVAGFVISPDVYAWVIVFVVPLNSALNPIIYTLM